VNTNCDVRVARLVRIASLPSGSSSVNPNDSTHPTEPVTSIRSDARVPAGEAIFGEALGELQDRIAVGENRLTRLTSRPDNAGFCSLGGTVKEETLRYSERRNQYFEEASQYWEEALEHCEEPSKHYGEALEYWEEASEHFGEALEYCEQASKYCEQAWKYCGEALKYCGEVSEYCEETSECCEEVLQGLKTRFSPCGVGGRAGVTFCSPSLNSDALGCCAREIVFG
jgi:tetratricopeptide (TPR) repeat protein